MLAMWARTGQPSAAIAALQACRPASALAAALGLPHTTSLASGAEPHAPHAASPAGALRHQLAFKATSTAASSAGASASAAGTGAVSGAAAEAAGSAAGSCAHELQGGAALRFDDHEAAFRGQPTARLLRAYLVLRACGVQPLVRHAESLLRLSRRVIGSAATNALVRRTFFAHFCAGENLAEVQRTTSALRARGVGSILDYAAEDDVGAGGGGGEQRQQQPPKQQQQQAGPVGPACAVAEAPAAARRLGVVGRTYDYASETQCDRHVEHFLSAVDTASRQPGRPAFAAIKMTALGNPQLLQRASTAVSTVHGLFAAFDEDGNGTVSREEFERQYGMLVGAVADDPRAMQEAQHAYHWLSEKAAGKVDYVAWCQQLDLRLMPKLAERLAQGPGRTGQQAVADVCLDDEEVALLGAMMGRLQAIAASALAKGVKLMVDAEHTYFQPAIEHLTIQLMRQHNRGEAHILNTYQAYLVDCRGRLQRDLEMARREGWTLGAKLVRGAYLHLERHRAAQLGLPSPCWPSLEQTHACYHACAEDLLQAAQHGGAEVLFGTHNQASIEVVVARMAELGLRPPGARVYFGQLLGMSDHMTLALGGAGYGAFKYVPYGLVEQVMPYLLRRATENQDIMKGAKHDLEMLRAELRRRAAAAAGLGAAPRRATAASGR